MRVVNFATKYTWIHWSDFDNLGFDIDPLEQMAMQLYFKEIKEGFESIPGTKEEEYNILICE